MQTLTIRMASAVAEFTLTTQSVATAATKPAPAAIVAPLTVEQAAPRVEQERATEEFWERPRCVGGCLSVVIVHRDLDVWHCSNLACGRSGFGVTVGGRKVRIVDNGAIE